MDKVYVIVDAEDFPLAYFSTKEMAEEYIEQEYGYIREEWLDLPLANPVGYRGFITKAFVDERGNIVISETTQVRSCTLEEGMEIWRSDDSVRIDSSGVGMTKEKAKAYAESRAKELLQEKAEETKAAWEQEIEELTKVFKKT